MKKMRLAALLLPFMMMATLAGCDAQDKQYDELCAKAADVFPLVLNSANGKEIYASEKVRPLDNYASVLTLKEFKYAEKDFTVDWAMTPAEKWVSSTYVLDEARNKMAPTYGKEDYDASLKATVSCLVDGKNRGKKELTWNFHVGSVDTVEMTLKALNEKFVANNYALGDLAKDSEGKDVTIATRGIITATFNPAKSGDLGSGVFIQDGEYGLQLFDTKYLFDLWKESGVKVGDCVFVVGKLSLYNGIIEMAPSMFEMVDATAYSIAKPVTIDLTNKTWDKTLKLNQSILATFADCKYKDGNVTAVGSHASINFTHGETNVLAYANYHIGEEGMTAIKNLVDTFIAGETTTTIKGILTFYNDSPQIIPIFGVNSFVNPTPVNPAETPEAGE